MIICHVKIDQNYIFLVYIIISHPTYTKTPFFILNKLLQSWTRTQHIEEEKNARTFESMLDLMTVHTTTDLDHDGYSLKTLEAVWQKEDQRIVKPLASYLICLLQCLFLYVTFALFVRKNENTIFECQRTTEE